jgi:hypothetical protein
MRAVTRLNEVLAAIDTAAGTSVFVGRGRLKVDPVQNRELAALVRAYAERERARMLALPSTHPDRARRAAELYELAEAFEAVAIIFADAGYTVEPRRGDPERNRLLVSLLAARYGDDFAGSEVSSFEMARTIWADYRQQFDRPKTVKNLTRVILDLRKQLS